MSSGQYGAGITEYTVTGLINLNTGELLVSGVYEGHLVSVDDDTAVGPVGYKRWADTYLAPSWQEAEQAAMWEWDANTGQNESDESSE